MTRLKRNTPIKMHTRSGQVHLQERLPGADFSKAMPPPKYHATVYIGGRNAGTIGLSHMGAQAKKPKKQNRGVASTLFREIKSGLISHPAAQYRNRMKIKSYRRDQALKRWSRMLMGQGKKRYHQVKR